MVCRTVPAGGCLARRRGDTMIMAIRTAREDQMRNAILISAILAATTTITPAAFAQTSTSSTSPAFSTRFFTTPLENDPSRDVRLQMQLHLPNRPGNPFHTHSGDQWEAVVEGEITFTVRGQEPRGLKAAETTLITAGTVPPKPHQHA